MLGTRRLFSQTFLRRKGLSSGSLAVDQLLLVLLGKLFQRGHFGLQGELQKRMYQASVVSIFPDLRFLGCSFIFSSVLQRQWALAVGFLGGFRLYPHLSFLIL